jgi:peptidoglycan/LPS O-acetylase OafA/YrhL
LTGFSVIVFIALPLFVISMAVALWRFRKSPARTVFLGVHVAVSVLALVGLGVNFLPLSVLTFGPGLSIAVGRLIVDLVDRRSRKEP